MREINFSKVKYIARLAIDGKFIYQEMSTNVYPEYIIMTVFSNGNDHRLVDDDHIDFICTGVPYLLSICTNVAQLNLGLFYVSSVELIEKYIYSYTFTKITCNL